MPILSILKWNKKAKVASPPIQRLPTEILQEIFFVHVWVNLDTPVRLILVCRYWNSIALAYSSLWGNIFYSDRSDYWNRLSNDVKIDDGSGVGSPGMGMDTVGNIGIGRCDRIDGMVQCSTEESIVRAIARTGNSKFELTVYNTDRYNWGYKPLMSDSTLKFRRLDIKVISSRCRLLRFLNINALNDFISWRELHDALVAPRKSSSDAETGGGPAPAEKMRFAALEEFLYLDGALSLGYKKSILETIYSGSPHLQTLAFPYIASDSYTGTLLQRLRKLSIRNTSDVFYNSSDTLHPKALQNVEEFHIRDSTPYLSISTPMPALKKASIMGVPLRVFPIDLYRQLTHLTLDYWYRGNIMFHEEVRTLPLLTYFAIYGQLGYIHTFRTPKLVTLIIRDIKKCDVYYDFATKSEDRNIRDMFPEILHIDSLSHIVSSNQFLDLMGQIGQNVKELYITYTRAMETISNELVDDLIGGIAARKNVRTGGRERVPICPSLQRLDILIPRTGRRSVKSLTKRNLQRLVKSRSSIAASGSLPLRRVRHGIYPPANSIKHPYEVWHAASRKWWLIEWEELLWL